MLVRKWNAHPASKLSQMLGLLLDPAAYLKGRALQDMQRDQAAIQAFDLALKLDGHSIFALAFKASTLQSLGRIDESKAMLREITAIPPKSHDEWDYLTGR